METADTAATADTADTAATAATAAPLATISPEGEITGEPAAVGGILAARPVWLSARQATRMQLGAIRAALRAAYRARALLPEVQELVREARRLPAARLDE